MAPEKKVAAEKGRMDPENKRASQPWHNNEPGARRKEYRNNKRSISNKNSNAKGNESRNGEWKKYGEPDQENWEIGLNVAENTDGAYKNKAVSKYRKSTTRYDPDQEETFRRSYGDPNEEERNLCIEVASYTEPSSENIPFQSARNSSYARHWNMEDISTELPIFNIASRSSQTREALAESLPRHGNETGTRKDNRNTKHFFDTRYPHANGNKPRDRKEWETHEESDENWETELNLAQNTDQSTKQAASKSEESRTRYYDPEPEKNFSRLYNLNEEPSNKNSPLQSDQRSNDAPVSNIESGCSSIETYPTYSEVVARSSQPCKVVTALSQHNNETGTRRKEYRNKKPVSDKYPHANGNESRNRQEWKTYELEENWETGINLAQSTDSSYKQKMASKSTKPSATRYYHPKSENFDQPYSYPNEGERNYFYVDGGACTKQSSINSTLKSVQHSNDARVSNNIESRYSSTVTLPTYSEVAARSISDEKDPLVNGNECKTYKESEVENWKINITLVQNTNQPYKYETASKSKESLATQYNDPGPENFGRSYRDPNECKAINELCRHVENKLIPHHVFPLEVGAIQNAPSHSLKAKCVRKNKKLDLKSVSSSLQSIKPDNINTSASVDLHNSSIRNLSNFENSVTGDNEQGIHQIKDVEYGWYNPHDWKTAQNPARNLDSSVSKTEVPSAKNTRLENVKYRDKIATRMKLASSSHTSNICVKKCEQPRIAIDLVQSNPKLQVVKHKENKNCNNSLRATSTESIPEVKLENRQNKTAKRRRSTDFSVLSKSFCAKEKDKQMKPTFVQKWKRVTSKKYYKKNSTYPTNVNSISPPVEKKRNLKMKSSDWDNSNRMIVEEQRLKSARAHNEPILKVVKSKKHKTKKERFQEVLIQYNKQNVQQRKCHKIFKDSNCHK